MNSLYTLALRQSSSLQSDLKQLDALSSSPSPAAASTSALNGQITASLAALDRTVDDYDAMARREIVDAKREKALARVARFRDEYRDLRKEYDRVKQRALDHKSRQDRSELFAGPSSSSAPYAPSSSSSSALAASSSSLSYGASTSAAPRHSAHAQQQQPFSPDVSIQMGTPPNPPPSFSAPGGGGIGGGYASPNSPYMSADYSASVHNNARTNYALREHDFLGSTGAALDGYLAQGQAVLGNLANQRDVMKGTQRRLLSAANTLGLSRSTITFIERRTKEDYYILLGGGAFTLVCFWAILHYWG
ncbi:Bos1p [Rhodotorula paludigena]|uniref:Bos1p n=1 Tax=Rhodotorula paludigena TaxID=86838 RepID=UPI0031758513